MKLVTFEINTPLGIARRLGLWRSPQVLDLNLAYIGMLSAKEEPAFAQRLADVLLPADMLKWIQAGSMGRKAAQEVETAWLERGDLRGADGEPAVFDQSAVRLLAPLPRPNTIRDFSTYEEHQKRATRAKGNGDVPEVWYRLPVYWKANPENTAGPEEDVIWPGYSQKLDFELEFGVYISRSGKNIPVEEASSFIAGYTIFNDISARDRQADEGVMTFGPAKGKDFDTAKVFGPCMVTPDEFEGRPHRMTAHINKEMWSDGSTGDMHWTFPQLISYVSEYETLRPGDFLGSGACPTGCGLELNRWIKPGDEIEFEVEGIGVLRNRIIQPG
jgi:2-keto-4-pentenoate hydratase/2-oxohepta-3-ene-1,7-dioic acid hydratase in catechol pathway